MLKEDLKKLKEHQKKKSARNEFDLLSYTVQKMSDEILTFGDAREF